MPSLGGWEFVILVGLLVLLFGAKRLPDMARSLGQSARVFKGEMKALKADEEKRAQQAKQQAVASGPTVAASSTSDGTSGGKEAPSPATERASEPGAQSGEASH